MDLRVNDQVTIPERELSWRFDTSGGPGGQHANRSATRVTLEFDVAASEALSEPVRSRILETEDETLVVSVDQTRSQWRNREIARERLAERLNTAMAPPPPRRRKTKPSRSARERRLTDKRRRSETKRKRRPPDWD